MFNRKERKPITEKTIPNKDIFGYEVEKDDYVFFIKEKLGHEEDSLLLGQVVSEGPNAFGRIIIKDLHQGKIHQSKPGKSVKVNDYQRITYEILKNSNI